jgi:hypothetical protein
MRYPATNSVLAAALIMAAASAPAWADPNVRAVSPPQRNSLEVVADGDLSGATYRCRGYIVGDGTGGDVSEAFNVMVTPTMKQQVVASFPARGAEFASATLSGLKCDSDSGGNGRVMPNAQKVNRAFAQ